MLETSSTILEHTKIEYTYMVWIYSDVFQDLFLFLLSRWSLVNLEFGGGDHPQIIATLRFLIIGGTALCVQKFWYIFIEHVVISLKVHKNILLFSSNLDFL